LDLDLKVYPYDQIWLTIQAKPRESYLTIRVMHRESQMNVETSPAVSLSPKAGVPQFP
jgi:hypothetical protein